MTVAASPQPSPWALAIMVRGGGSRDEGVGRRVWNVVRAEQRLSCVECLSVIAPGTAYELCSSADAWPVLSWAECLPCASWGRAFADMQRAIVGSSGWELGAMWQTIGAFVAARVGSQP